MDNILVTKLQPPRLPSQLVERSRLLELLDTGHKLTLLQAPAGFGKTTLVTQWIAHRQAQAEVAQRNTMSVAWLSLDHGDNDPVRFWSSLMIACQSFHANIGRTALAHLSQVSRSPFSASFLETTLTLLLNDLAREAPAGVVILEDYHLIEHARIHETVAFFINHLPASLQLMILTRSEPPLPLVRWRARGELLEVQSDHLRFTSEETTSFLQLIVSQSLSQKTVQSLHTRLEGWPTGLRLLALSLQNRVSPQGVEDAIAHLAPGSPNDQNYRFIQEFFLREVLEVQSEPLQLFLLQTSLLSRLTPSLCDAVTGRRDSAHWLELAERSGFFLETLDSVVSYSTPPRSSQGDAGDQTREVARQWYRYHALFAEVMKAEAKRCLGEETLQNLAARAGRWYEEHGMLVEAIEAFLSAQEFEHAAHLIERLNEHAYFSEYHTMWLWLELLPEPLLHEHPGLCFLFALARIFSEDTRGPVWRIEPVEDLLQLAESGWREQGDLAQVGILYAFRATFTVVHGFIAPAVEYARQALHFLPPLAAEQPEDHLRSQPVEWVEWRCGCFITLSLQAMQHGTFDDAHRYLLEAYMLSLHNEDRVFTRVIGRMLGEVSMELGELHRAASYYQQTLAEPPWPDERGEVLFRAQLTSGLIRLSYEWNELAKATQLAQEASGYRYGSDFPFAEAEVHTKIELLKILLLHTRGEVAEAHASLSALFVHLQATPHMLSLIPEVLLWQARFQIREGDRIGAEHTIETLATYAQKLTSLQQETQELLKARLLLARNQAATALPILERWLASAQSGKHIIRTLEIQLLIALAYAAFKRGKEARQVLSLVLVQARNEGFIRLFLDEGELLIALLRSLLPSLTEKPVRSYAETILRAWTDPLHIAAARANSTERSLLEPLSAQERRVLRLLAAGRSNPEIAEELVVSINTVKGHVKNLYRKLDVTTRVQASEVARREKLI